MPPNDDDGHGPSGQVAGGALNLLHFIRESDVTIADGAEVQSRQQTEISDLISPQSDRLQSARRTDY